MRKEGDRMENVRESNLVPYFDADFNCNQQSLTNKVDKLSTNLNLDYDAPFDFADKFVSRLLDEGKDLMTPSDIQFTMDVDSNYCQNNENPENDVNPLLKAMTNGDNLLGDAKYTGDTVNSFHQASPMKNESFYGPKSFREFLSSSSEKHNDFTSRSSVDRVFLTPSKINEKRQVMSTHDKIDKVTHSKSQSCTLMEEEEYNEKYKKRGFTVADEEKVEGNVSKVIDEPMCQNLSEWIQRQSMHILNGAVIPEFNRKVDLLKHYACSGRIFLDGNTENNENLNSELSVSVDPKSTKRSFFKKISDAFKQRVSITSQNSPSMNRSSVSSTSSKSSFFNIRRNRSHKESSVNLLSSKKNSKRKHSMEPAEIEENDDTILVYVYEKQESVFKTRVKLPVEDITLYVVKKNMPLKKKNQRYFFKCVDSEGCTVYIETKNNKAAVPSYNNQIVCKILRSC